VNDRIFVEARMKAEELLPAVKRRWSKWETVCIRPSGNELPLGWREVERAIAAGAAQPLKQANAALDEATQTLATLLLERALKH